MFSHVYKIRIVVIMVLKSESFDVCESLAYHSGIPVSSRACGLSGMHSGDSLLKGAVG